LLFPAHILPPWASTILLDMNNPNPVPDSDFVANFVNSLGIISGSIPLPLSLTLIVIALLSCPFFVVMDMIPHSPE
jgi:hypothetical protein